MKHFIRTLLSISFGLTVAGLFALPARATTYSLTTSSACTISDAIIASNTDSVSGSCPSGSGNDTIDLAAGTYTLSADLPAITSELTINGASKTSTLIDGNNHQYSGILAVATGTLSINNLSIQNMKIGAVMGSWGCYGSGLCSIDTNLNLTHVTIQNNQNCGISSTRASGGTDGNALTFDDVMSINQIAGDPSLPFICGLFVLNDGTTTNPDHITISDSSFSDNSSATSGNFVIGIFIQKNSLLNLANSTLSGNRNIDTVGLGLITGERGVTLTNVTISDNGTTNADILSVAGIYASYDTIPISLKNVLLAKNAVNGAAANCGAALYSNLSAGHNLSDDATCASYFNKSGDKNSLDAKIGNLALDSNTYVIPLLADSPAINAGTSDGAPATDQRGVSRPQGSAFDIGAYEYQFGGGGGGGSGGGDSDNGGAENYIGNILPRVGRWMAWLAPIALAAMVTFAYVYLDWKRHKRRIDAIKADNNYTLWHHLRVVTFPLFRYRLRLEVDHK